MKKNITKAPPGHISFSDAASRYKAVKSTIKAWSKKGLLPTVQPGGDRGTKYVEIAALEKRLKESNVQSIFKDDTSPLEASTSAQGSASPNADDIETIAPDETNTQQPDNSSKPEPSEIKAIQEHPERNESNNEEFTYSEEFSHEEPDLLKYPKVKNRKRNKRLSDDQIDRIIMKRTPRQLLHLRDKITDVLTQGRDDDTA
ncbi:hypothetical protein ACFPK9_10645 [Rubritalea spongiae]|uniref:HTH merR-type domain-containing protein n=1 Tax=Rubritalea spongiae TaxID=430797 RepID=A0ABW5DXR9_9BACT